MNRETGCWGSSTLLKAFHSKEDPWQQSFNTLLAVSWIHKGHFCCRSLRSITIASNHRHLIPYTQQSLLQQQLPPQIYTRLQKPQATYQRKLLLQQTLLRVRYEMSMASNRIYYQPVDCCPEHLTVFRR